MYEITKVRMNEAIKQTFQTNESWKKQQELVATLEVKESHLTIEVAKLLKRNRQLLEAKKKDKAEVDILKKEFGQMQKALDHARLGLVDLESLQGKLDELNVEVVRLRG